MRRESTRGRSEPVAHAVDGGPSPPHTADVAGDLDYEVALLALADSAAANLAAGRSDPRDPAALAASIAAERGVAPDAVSLALFTRIAMSPQLLQLPTERAIELQLGTLASLAGLNRVSLWAFELVMVARRFSFGRGAGGAAERAMAETLLDLGAAASSLAEGGLVAATVLREDVPAAAVVARPASRRRTRVEPFISVACGALGLVLERETLLERGTGTAATLVAAHERRLTRLAFDLHDGPLQEIAVMAADLHAARSRAEEVLPPPGREQVIGCFDGLSERLSELDGGLREVARSLETAGVIHEPLADVLRREVDAFKRQTEIRARLRVTGDLDDLTDSQKIALLRVVQEALGNVREHSEASSVSVTLRGSASSTRLEIVDDGRGFDVERELVESARRGRLGLVGASERVRLLGGTFAIRSRPADKTRLVVLLPRYALLSGRARVRTRRTSGSRRAPACRRRARPRCDSRRRASGRCWSGGT